MPRLCRAGRRAVLPRSGRAGGRSSIANASLLWAWRHQVVPSAPSAMDPSRHSPASRASSEALGPTPQAAVLAAAARAQHAQTGWASRPMRCRLCATTHRSVKFFPLFPKRRRPSGPRTQSCRTVSLFPGLARQLLPSFDSHRSSSMGSAAMQCEQTMSPHRRQCRFRQNRPKSADPQARMQLVACSSLAHTGASAGSRPAANTQAHTTATSEMPNQIISQTQQANGPQQQQQH